MKTAEQVKNDILSDLRVELTGEFDRNFERKGFFSDRWRPRAREYPKGSLLMVTGAMRRSISSKVEGHGVRFTSSVPYTALHNEGGTGTVTVRQHQRKSRKGHAYTVRQHQRSMAMPQRQFIGDGPDTQRIIRTVIDDNLNKFNLSLSSFLRKK